MVSRLLAEFRKRLDARALVVTAFVFSIGLVQFIPPYERVFVGQRWALAFARLMLGLLDFPGLFVQLFLDMFFQSPIAYLVWLIAAALFAGFVFSILWRAGRPGRLVLGALILLNAAFGAFGVLMGDLLVDSTPVECERAISDAQVIKIVTYHEIGWEAGEPLFLMASRDGKKSWTQLIQNRYDDLFSQWVDPDCSTVAVQDERTYAVWLWRMISITRDGGETWRTVDLSAAAGVSQVKGMIKGVKFVGGEMRVEVESYEPGAQTTMVTSSDGGVTWRVAQ